MDPYELEVVYPREPNSQRQLDIDVVAVHGLNIEGHYIHYRDTWTMNRKLWLRDTLPSALAKRCRVMLFSYNACSTITEQDTKLEKHSNRLLELLKVRRLEAPRRPLIFICHDIGGLIVKDALVKANLGIPYRSIAQTTRLLVFFNTPHRDIGTVARTIAEAAIRVPEQHVLERLERECEQLAERIYHSELRRRIYDKRQVINLYGTNAHRGQKILVTKKDTLLSLPDYWEKHLPIYGDHTSMCKFASSRDAACQIVVKTIAMEIVQALEMHPC